MADPTNTEILSEAAKEPTIVDIPVIPADTPTPIRRVLESMREYVQVISGRRGNDLDTAVTFRDLVKSGIATVDLSQSARSGAVPVSLTSEVEIDYSTPPAPTALTATGGFEQIFLGWNGAGFASYAFTEIWRAASNDLSQAVLVGTSVAALYVDTVPSNATRYYWVRFVSKASVKGPYNSTSGTSATSAINTQYVLSTLTGAITQSQLFTSLSSKIDLIDAPFSTAGSVDARVKALQDSTNSEIASLQSQVNELINIPAYSGTTTYNLNDQVTYNGSLYKATQTTTGNLPTNTTYWTLIGNYTSLGDAVAAHTTQINSLNSGLATEISDRTTLYNQVNNATTGLPATRTMLVNDYYTKNAADTAIASATSSLVSNTSLTNTLGSYATTAFLSTNNYTKTQTDSAITSATSNLVSNTTLTNTLGSYATTAFLSTNNYTKTQTDSAISSATLNLVSNTSLNTTLGSYVTSAALTTNYYTKTATDGAISSASTTLTSNYQSADAATLSNAQTYTQNYAYTKAQTDSAISTQVNTVAARLNNGGDTYTAINNVTNTAAAKSANFVQSTAPTATKTDDLWIDTANGNALKRWNGNAWVSAEDTRIGSTATSVQTLQSSIDATTTYRIDAKGFSASQTTFGVYNAAGTRLYAPSTGWSVLVLNRSTAAVVSHSNYNTYSSAANATSMATALDGLGTDRVVVCYTYDEPRTNVYNNATLITALERCGATAAAIGNIKNRGAYILVGIPGRGAGTGYEKYAGAFSSDPNAFVTYTLQLVKGEPVGQGTTGTVALEIKAETQASQITGLQGQYTVKIDNNGHVSGFGLASVTNNGTPESAFIVRADKFALASPSDTSNPLGTTSPTTNLPFIVTTTTSYAPNGDAIPAGVYIDSAYIKNGSIETAKIKDLTANKITSGYTSAAIGFNGAKVYGAELYSGGSVTVSTDGNGNITGFTPVNPTFKVASGIVDIKADAFRVTNGGATTVTPFLITGNTVYIDGARIGSYIRSSNYVAGSTGWNIDTSTGNSEFNSVTARGEINSGSYTGYAWPSSGGGFHSSRYGVLMGNANAGQMYFQYWANVDGGATPRYFTFGTGNGRYLSISDTGISTNMTLSGSDGTFSGTLTANAINAVNTINIAGNAVTIASVGSGVSTDNGGAGVLLTMNGCVAGQPIILIASFGGAGFVGANQDAYNGDYRIVRNDNGVSVAQLFVTPAYVGGGAIYAGVTMMAIVDNAPAGTNYFWARGSASTDAVSGVGSTTRIIGWQGKR